MFYTFTFMKSDIILLIFLKSDQKQFGNPFYMTPPNVWKNQIMLITYWGHNPSLYIYM